jgi:hypothetical protein
MGTVKSLMLFIVLHTNKDLDHGTVHDKEPIVLLEYSAMIPLKEQLPFIGGYTP